ncbi:MAG: metallophosphoesterase [Deltaproteobacteria bacterium]|jgi:hypothetical protein|nr:metallophosphoesterase [Deltaproteobacteria bacterium]MBW2536586.1 metallophosphoesterase [Deltaproteobacteria bacterium]
MPRTIIVGDVHGCADELGDLLDAVSYAAGDQVVLVGDLIGRGPLPHRTVALARRVGARAVLGNHEDHFLRWHAGNPGAKDPPSANELKRRAHAAQLDGADWEFLGALPLWLELPSHDALVVHAGLVPGVPIDQQQRRVLLSIRCLSATGAPVTKREGDLWASRYAGPPQVVFGHHALEAPQIHPWATGLDTGCVYGGRLTALVLGEGEPVPAVALRAEALRSVPARRTYEPIR